jgi:hypothetical protein
MKDRKTRIAAMNEVLAQLEAAQEKLGEAGAQFVADELREVCESLERAIINARDATTAKYTLPTDEKLRT